MDGRIEYTFSSARQSQYISIIAHNHNSHSEFCTYLKRAFSLDCKLLERTHIACAQKLYQRMGQRAPEHGQPAFVTDYGQPALLPQCIQATLVLLQCDQL